MSEQPVTRQTPPDPAPEPLAELAARHGVATEYWDWQGRHVTVPARTVTAVLGALGVPAATDDDVRASLQDADDAPWRRMLPATVVVRRGHTAAVPVHVPHGDDVTAWVAPEDGGRVPLHQQDVWIDPRPVDGQDVGRATFTVPADLPLGWHTLHAEAGDRTAHATLVVVPDVLDQPPALDQQRWGLMAQLYSVRSERSWGVGDLADLAELADWAGRDLGADFVLVNPLHAAQPVAPMEPSPYLPTSRRFVNPLYVRVEDVREVAYLPSTDRALIEWQADDVRRAAAGGGEIDRDAAWAAKLAALETVYAAPRSPARQADLDAYRRREGEGLTRFATWCALAERFGLPTDTWPAGADDPDGEYVAGLREDLAERVEFHCWLQWVADTQREDAHRAALRAGMAHGVVHDLAVGVHPDGADVWSLGRALVGDLSVGAPPDAYNQQGQDWDQPPWHPGVLAELGYAPFRDMLRSVLRHGGGVRVDHVMGLFRLWCIPRGAAPGEGTYVRYDHEALVGILCLEAQRAGVFVVGEDLGTVEPWVRGHLRERGILGTSVLWFERDDRGPVPPERWRELCLATVTTHDLPPTAAYLAGEHVDLRAGLGLLTRDAETEAAEAAAERDAVVAVLRERGLLPPDPTERQTVEALHGLLTAAPSRLLGVALTDAVGERRAQNLPGTHREYPNWKVPLADGSGVPVLLEELRVEPRPRSLARVVSGDAPDPAPTDAPDPAPTDVTDPGSVDVTDPVPGDRPDVAPVDVPDPAAVDGSRIAAPEGTDPVGTVAEGPVGATD